MAFPKIWCGVPEIDRWWLVVVGGEVVFCGLDVAVAVFFLVPVGLFYIKQGDAFLRMGIFFCIRDLFDFLCIFSINQKGFMNHKCS